MFRSYFYFLMLLVIGCQNEEPTAFTVLGETIKLPLSIAQTKKFYHLNLKDAGRLYKVDTNSCKVITACFWYGYQFNTSKTLEENVWGINIAVDTSKMLMKEFVSKVEQDLNVKFKSDTLFTFTPYLRAEKDNFKFAIRQAGIYPSVSSLPTCFSKKRLNTLILYISEGLSEDEFRYYVITEGTNINGN